VALNAKLKINGVGLLVSKIRYLYSRVNIYILILFAYPTIFMWPAVKPGASALMQYTGSLDTSGTVFGAQALRRMKFPWSQNLMINPPDGISTVTLANLVQSVRLISLWILVKFLDPIQSVSIMVLVGWILTGIAAFSLARYLKASTLGAFAAGLICESLPWMREKAMTHVAYVYMCIPLFLILLGLKFLENRERKYFLQYLLVLAASFFFDLYWFAFSVILTLFFLLIFTFQKVDSATFNSNSESHIKLSTRAIKTGIGLTSFLLIAYTTQSRFKFLDHLVWDDSMIDQFGGSLVRFVTPPSDHLVFSSTEQWFASREDIVNYAGISVLVAALLAMFTGRLYARRQDFQMRLWLLAIAIVFGLLTLPTQIGLFGIDMYTPVHYMKFLFPRIRVFARAGLITEVVLGVLAGLFISDLTRVLKGKYKILGLQILLIVVVLIDLNPLGRRFVNNDYSKYSEVRRELNSKQNPVVAVVPLELDRNGFPLFVLNNAITAFPSDRTFEEDLRLSASQGTDRFFSFLRNRGVTHVLLRRTEEAQSGYVYKWGEIPQVDLLLTEPYFTKVVESSFEQADELFLLNESFAQIDCEWCSDFRLKWTGVRPTFYSQGYFEGQFYEDKDISWVLPSENPSFEVVSEVPTKSFFKVTFMLHAAYGANARPQVVRIQYGTNSMTKAFGAGSGLSVEFMVQTGQQIRLNSYLPCVSPDQIDPNNPDKREICYAISDLSVVQLEPPR
jgi:hypothetical protein